MNVLTGKDLENPPDGWYFCTTDKGTIVIVKIEGDKWFVPSLLNPENLVGQKVVSATRLSVE